MVNYIKKIFHKEAGRDSNTRDITFSRNKAPLQFSHTAASTSEGGLLEVRLDCFYYASNSYSAAEDLFYTENGVDYCPIRSVCTRLESSNTLLFIIKGQSSMFPVCHHERIADIS